MKIKVKHIDTKLIGYIIYIFSPRVVHLDNRFKITDVNVLVQWAKNNKFTVESMDNLIAQKGLL